MTPFRTLTSVAAPFPEADIDTDVIFPARFLLLPDKTGLGKVLFHERRFGGGRPRPEFVLDRTPYDTARILVAGRNFGSGSSREQAVWALADFGIRCVVAPSFGEIFSANCCNNGVLPVVLPPEPHARVLEAAEAGQDVTVDLETQTVRCAGGGAVVFDVEAHRKHSLLLGLDEIGAILAEDADDIDRFEGRHRARYPWLHLDEEARASLSDLGAGVAP